MNDPGRASTLLADIALVESRSGDEVRLGSLWQDRAALLLFVRHFG